MRLSEPGAQGVPLRRVALGRLTVSFGVGAA